jgi:hypothetical protein
MSQLNLFEPERAIPEPRPSNPAFIRKNLNRVLNIARAAEIMPWNAADEAHWESFFPKLASLLPQEEGAALDLAFKNELARLRNA